ncbi:MULTISPECIES: hypothetical protein [unclassified Streptomyces]|uniref:hypothetical protein n=1 Tax=unclassified Streptomyces TaxID=2593676 RepID=UPI000B848083|nr:MULTISPECIES: hypothetical protein [unclassified Streptomyces]MYZ36500.1 hypothetical protein [Streptomyces sp. SID4917]
MQQAAEKADAIMLETVSGIRPELRWNHGPSNDRICTGFKDESPGTGSVKRRIAVMTVVSEERRGSLLGVVERNWKARGYEITSVDADKDLPAIYAASPENFRMSVAVGGEGQFFFSITTPCFTESAVPDPATEPNSPQRAGEYPTRPDVYDDFWSSGGGVSVEGVGIS